VKYEKKSRVSIREVVEMQLGKVDLETLETRIALSCHKRLKKLQDRFYRAKIKAGTVRIAFMSGFPKLTESLSALLLITKRIFLRSQFWNLKGPKQLLSAQT
jgi:hypothetical protein